MVSDTTELSDEPAEFQAATRKSYDVLADNPPTVADVASTPAVAPLAHGFEPVRYSTRKPDSLAEASVQVAETDVEPVDATDTPVGAAGADGGSSSSVMFTVTLPLTEP